MADPRTFKVETPHMKGDDVKEWQKEIKAQFAQMNIACPITPDGNYGIATRTYSASLLHALGMNAQKVMADGITPQLRTRVRARKLTVGERNAFEDRVEYRRKLRDHFAASTIAVHRPVTRVLADSWGYHPGVHDGLDVIAQPDAVIFAMVKSKVIDVRSSGWWGLGAPTNPAVKAKGDGILQLEVLETVGPFIKGYHIGYGHAEKAKVKVGTVVEAGRPIAHVGLANAWHIHLMVNKGNTTKGIGNLDPRPFLDYAVKYG